MCRSRTTLALALMAAVLAPADMASADANVNYSGKLLHSPGGLPVDGGFVIAGTFAPGFEPSTYFQVYGDGSGNVAPNHYMNATFAGSFLPIGLPVLTTAAGFFAGSGTTNAAAGTPVYVFAFPVHPDLGQQFGVIATGSDAAFLVPAGMGSTSINFNLANNFLFGSGTANGLAAGQLPIPEPHTFVLTVIGAAAISGFRTAQRR
jgi:hypothetical protein